MRRKREFPQEVHDEVTHLASIGMTWKQIATVIDVPLATAERHFGAAYKKGRVHAEKHVMGVLWRHIESPDPKTSLPACMFFLKTKCGWRERERKKDAEKPVEQEQQKLTVEVSVKYPDEKKDESD